MEQKFAINQRVWILQWDIHEGQDRMTVDMPYRIQECRVVSAHGGSDIDYTGRHIPAIRYSLADEIGGNEINNNIDLLQAMRRDFSEYQLFDSYDAASLAIIQKIEERIGELEKMKSEYLLRIEEHKKEKQLLDDELFQL